VTEEERQRAIRTKLARMNDRPTGVLATGFATLDSALGVGGLLHGTLAEISGPSSSGKTTLALQIVAHAQRSGLTAAWLNADHTFDPTYAATLGVTIEGMPLAEPETAEQALEIARQLAASSAVDLLVVDSAAALVPRLELEPGIGGGTHGLQARVLASGLRQLVRTMAGSGTVALFLNQIRSRPDRTGADFQTTAGGPSLRLYAATRIALEPGAAGRIRFRILKNKAAAAFTRGELRLRKGAGFAPTP
jgi:recombination protein RecA